MKRVYENVQYMGRAQTFTYMGTQENPFGEDIHLYNGEPDDNNMAPTLSQGTLETLLKLEEYKR